ncbi:MAG: alpha/beta fold hydrolase [Alphaproteobacteria bacterium]|nr:alpha/beta fold hydrolase [Alphaproteobacteria bacterium]
MGTNEFYGEAIHGKHHYFDLGNFPLIKGGTLRGAKLAYKTHGTLNARKSNAILFPHMYSGSPMHMEMFVGKGRTLDPAKYFIILPGQLGNGISTSPSNTGAPFNQAAFPQVMIGDDVVAQHRLLTQKFGIKELQLVLGWSMGAQQTYEWAIRFPDMVMRAAPFAGTAKTSDHCKVFLKTLIEALTTDSAFAGGFYREPHAVHRGLRRHANLFALMGACQQLYTEQSWRALGFSSLEDFLAGFWQNWFLPMDPNNLMCMMRKWHDSDVSLHTGGDLKAALGRIKAKTYVIAFANDMFFPVADQKADQKLIRKSEFKVIDTLWAHFAMLCLTEADRKAIDKHLADLLNEKV